MGTVKEGSILLSKENILENSLLKSTTPLSDGPSKVQYGSTNEGDVPLIIGTDDKNTNDLDKLTVVLTDGHGSIQEDCRYSDDAPLSLVTDNKAANCFAKCKSFSIEPFVFAFMFAYYINKSCLTNMIMDKGCLYSLNFTKEVCNNLSAHSTEKDMVEIIGDNYTLYANLLQIFGAFQMMFIAPWSDQYSRKVPMIMSVVGMILSEFGLLLCSIYFESALYFIIISRIPSEFFGGFICSLTLVYSHVSEMTSKQTRALSFAYVEIAMGLGMTFGGLTGGLMYDYGYAYTFLTAMVIHCLCLPWIVFCIRETTGLDNSHTWREKICNFFALDNFSKGWKAAVRRRENNGRVVLLMLFASMCVIVLTLQSLDALGFVFMHHLYDWNQGKYSTINTYFVASQMVFLGLCMPVLFRKFKVTDSFMGMIGVLSMMAKYGLISFSKLSIYLFYLGNILGSLYGLSMFLIRSVISKLADKDELGRVFAFLATCEAIFPMFGTIFVTKIFNATMDTFPNVTYMMTAGFLILPLINFGWLYWRSRENGTTSSPTS